MSQTCGAHCTKCPLGAKAPKALNNVNGWGNPQAKFVILLDEPGNVLAEKLLIWLLKRMSLGGNDVWIDYVFKCELPYHEPKKKELQHPLGECWKHYPRTQVFDSKSLVIIGNWGCQFIAGAKMKTAHGKKDVEKECWVAYSLLYLLMNPAECVEMSCVLWTAAEEAGLHPVVNLNVEPFRFPSKKLVGG